MIAADPHSPLMSINFREALNEEQYAAVTAEPGPALVLAGAGSGKTRTLTYRVAYLLSQGLNPWEILLLTFTNKAAKEMLARVENLTGIPAYKFWGGTFHHIGQKILRQHGEAIGLSKAFTIIDQSDAENLLSDVIRNHNPGFLKNKDNPKAKLIANIFSYARNTLTPLSELLDERYPYFDFISDELEIFFKKYQERKAKEQVLDYDDLLEKLLKLLQQEPAIAALYQERFKHVLVDEYQDTNRLQASIVDLLGSHHRIMAVGDDAQCIYTWRGADHQNIMSFPDRHPGAIIYKIETNYRSTPNILALANDVLTFQSEESGYNKTLKATRSTGPSPYFVPILDTRQQAQFILKRISGLYQEGVALSDIAILYRAHHHSMDLQMELSRQNLSYQITSGVRFFEQAHIRDLVAQLRFLHNPNDTTAFVRFSSLLPKVGPKTAEKLLTLANKLAEENQTTVFKALDNEAVLKKVPELAKEHWTDLAYTLQDAAENLDKLSPQEIVRILIEAWYGDFLKTLFTNWSAREDDLQSLLGFAGRYQDMGELLAQLVLLNSETSDRSVDMAEDALRLTTIHQAKGLEFKVVFVIGLAEKQFPIRRAIEEGNIDEELRLFYVAVTRAQDELYLLSPKMTLHGASPELLQPSRFVTGLSPESYEVLHVNKPSW
tara:strand:- start:38640 stop:40628 length:1989 start_codon:yes stop_codon:yes gene_type:complete